MSPNQSKWKYKAFISYKHSKLGEIHATALERGLKRYAKPVFQRPMKILRDKKHMVPDNDLSALITNGLEQSEYLIFLAEQDSATSPWCQDELEYWCNDLGRKDKLILIHVNDTIKIDLDKDRIDWEQTNALPSLLNKYLLGIPLYVDLSWTKNPKELDLNHIKYKTIINLIAAKLKGLTPEALNDEELRTYRRNRRLRNWAVVLLSLLLMTSIGTSILAFQQQKVATESAQLAKNKAQEAQDSSRVAQKERAYAKLQEGIALDSAKVAQQQRAYAVLQQKIAGEKAEEAKYNLNKFKKTYSTYLSAEAQGAFEIDDSQLAFRLGQKALEFDPENELAELLLSKKLLNYLSCSFTDVDISETKFSDDGKTLIFFDHRDRDTGTLNVLSLETFKLETYPNTYRYVNYWNGSKYLIFFDDYINNKSATFNLLNLETGEIYSFTNIREQYVHLSKEYKFLSFYDDFFDDEATLNILNIETAEIKSYPKSDTDSEGFECDDKYFVFFNNVDKRKLLGTLNMLNLETGRVDSFSSVFYKKYTTSFRFSNNCEFLSFINYDRNTDTVTLTIIHLETGLRDSFPIGSPYFKYDNNDEYLIFFNGLSSENSATLNILNLKTRKVKCYPNCYYDYEMLYSYFHPNGEFLSFFDDRNENSARLNVLNLETGLRYSFPDCYFYKEEDQNERFEVTFNYSSDGNFISFIDNVDVNEKSARLNLLCLETGELKSFPSCYFDNFDSQNQKYRFIYPFVYDSKFLIFFNDVRGRYGTLNLLDLETGGINSFVNSHTHIRRINKEFLCFYGKVDYSPELLKILNLKTGELTSFNNASSGSLNFSENGKFMSFIGSIDNQPKTLNILNLETKRIQSFDNFTHADTKFSSKSRYFSFNENDETIKIWDVEREKVVRLIQHQTEIKNYHFLNDEHFLISSSLNVGSEGNGVIKVTDLSVSEDEILKYYDQFFDQLTKQERAQFGLD